MKKTVVIVIVTLMFGAIGAYGISQYHAKQQEFDLLSRLHTMEQVLSETKKELFGFTRYTDYLTTTKKAISEQMKFLAATVDREYVHVEHIERSKFGLKSEATIILEYAVEYSVGFDLRPESFSVSADNSGIVVSLKKAQLVASPSVTILSHEIPSKGFMIDEKTAVIELQKQLNQVAQKRGQEIVTEEAVAALCEKKLAGFLVEFLSRQSNVKIVPAIRFAYQ